MYEWDDVKNARNLARHGIGFEAMGDFDWDRSIIVDRSRHADGERRFAGIGPLHGKIYTVIYTWRGGTMRIISLRRANRKEEKTYAENV
jgi:uncharacterized protein